MSSSRGRASAARLSHHEAQRNRRAYPSEVMPVILTTPDQFDRWLEAADAIAPPAAAKRRARDRCERREKKDPARCDFAA